MRNNLRNLVITICAAIGAYGPISAIAANSLCTPSGYTLGFFNGVFTSEQDAIDDTFDILELVPATLNGKDVTPEVFYNHTGCGTAGTTCLQDVLEVFIQRGQELDSSGGIASHIELFWESIGSGQPTFTNQISALLTSAAALFSNLQGDLRTQIAADWSTILSSPPTASDYSIQNARLDALAIEGQMLLLVAHSQGNLFVNQAYDHILPTIGAGSVKVVHIAPASASLNGEYTTADIDLVIGALRAIFTSVPDYNISLPASVADVTGHTVPGTYLDSSRAARSQISSQTNAALNALVPSTLITSTNVGSFTVTLTWSGSGDEDLHIFEPSPSNSHVYYANKTGVVGFLDTDNTVGFGPEHYYASCDPNVLETGNYQIAINNYNGADNEIATLQVATPADGVLLTKQMNTGATVGPAGNSSPVSVLNVSVSKDPTTGIFSISAQ